MPINKKTIKMNVAVARERIATRPNRDGKTVERVIVDRFSYEDENE